MIRKQLIPLSVGLALLIAGLFAAYRLASVVGRPEQARPRPVITVEVVYPGASAQVVADTVSAPIEQQVNGAEKMLYLWSRCTNEGKYTASVVFKDGVDLNQAQVLVQSRVSLAVPMLPDAVTHAGVTVRKGSCGAVMILSLTSPDGSRDRFFLSDCILPLGDEMARLPGVGEVASLGTSDHRTIRVSLDADKMAARKLTVVDMVEAIRQGRIRAGAITPSPAGRPLEGRAAAEPQDRPPEMEQFGEMAVRATPGGRVDRLKDVARSERGDQGDVGTAFNGKPAAVQVIFAAWQANLPELSTALHDKVSDLRATLPEGVRLDVAFEFAPNSDVAGRSACLLVAPVFPPHALATRMREILIHFESRLRGVERVQDVLILPENPFDRLHNQACMLVRLSPAGAGPAEREEVINDIRSRLAHVNDATVRIRDLSGPSRFPQCGYPVQIAVYGPSGDDTDKLRELAAKLADRLRESEKLTDVWAGPAFTPCAGPCLDMDRASSAKFGVSIENVSATLQAYYGSVDIDDFKYFGRSWQVKVGIDAGGGKEAGDIGKLMVRTVDGRMVALGSFAELRETKTADVVERLNLYPAVAVTANPAPGVSLAQVRALCETLLEEARKELGLTDGYRLQWL